MFLFTSFSGFETALVKIKLNTKQSLYKEAFIQQSYRLTSRISFLYTQNIDKTLNFANPRQQTFRSCESFHSR